jgi:malto-oligosyltrehalose trehalohydrolase/4-alpha-glucanotransferase
MPYGAELRPDGKIRFRVWAPGHELIRVAIDGRADTAPLVALQDGWHELITHHAEPGSRYWFVLPDGKRFPDPASRFQPEDVHGPSEVIDPSAYAWEDTEWRGRPWHEAVLYELHIGAFTPEGNFRAAVGKLDYLVSLGVTAIEIMPIGDFPGKRNWGYDGVLPYAPDSSYGRPEDFKAFIDAAHARGLMVILDVVYNHFGPEGAYIHSVAPEFFNARHKTPWGAAINIDGRNSAPVREFFIHNALYWIEEFHLDGLRLDAVHAIRDDSPKHLIAELAERVRSSVSERHLHLILENEENAVRWLMRSPAGDSAWYTAQWNDDAHHVLHVAATAEESGYYADYLGHTQKLGRALAEGFAFQGEVMPFRGRPRGEPSAALPPSAFVAFIQNHDQVGNRAFGERITNIASEQAVRAIAALYLLLPQIPMLFMGEEWGAAQPFPFFCDFGAELAEAVRNGRRQEFARFPEFQDPRKREKIPDPTALETFLSAKLAWDDTRRGQHARWLSWYTEVIAVRQRDIVPLLQDIRSGGTFELVGDRGIIVRWQVATENAELVLEANLSSEPISGFLTQWGRIIWEEGYGPSDGTLDPFAIRWSLAPLTGKRDLPGESPLDRLAQQMGIEPQFRNARGDLIETSEATKRRLLSAMGFAVDSQDDARTAIAQLEEEGWTKPLSPVVVLKEDQALVVAVTLPSTTTAFSWKLSLEDGSERSVEEDFARLDLVGQKSIKGQRLERRLLHFNFDLPRGYHQLSLNAGATHMTLIVVPARCWLPSEISEGQRLWGLAAQLYLLRSARNWGIGDFSDLRDLVIAGAARGADVIGLNPLHAPFPDDPENASPYSPASRLLLNFLNIDVEAIPELQQSSEARTLLESQPFHKELDTCRAESLVDYKCVNRLKLQALELLFTACQNAPDQDRWRSFEAFRRERGQALNQACLFLALREHFVTEANWHAWPAEYQKPDNPDVRAFAREHEHRLSFFAWLQWVAEEQLSQAATVASEHGMRVGLYRDLAVGANALGAETWVSSDAVVANAHVGAPPDIYNPAGQDWGLPPFNPQALRRDAYRSFIELLRANMRYAGALRIDHAMALQHLYWIPKGEKASAGAYVSYPIEDLVGILALESHRNHCLVVGEDLGTVPEGFRERMASANILSYRVLFFEQTEDGAFLPPGDYPALALAVAGSHDLPTFRGWWEGYDIQLKDRLGLFPEPSEAEHQTEQRRLDREQLVGALLREGLLGASDAGNFARLVEAVHRYLARTKSALAMVQLDDIADEVEPVNLPATSDEYPNWRRRLSLGLEHLRASARFVDITDSVDRERRQR